MRALVTRSSGCLGSQIALFLSAEGVDVMRIKHTALGRNYVGIERIIKENKPDIVFHLAGTYQTVSTFDMLEANCLFASKLLDAIKANGIGCRVVLMGTGAEYGPLQESGFS